jgi:hypothetical protein
MFILVNYRWMVACHCFMVNKIVLLLRRQHDRTLKFSQTVFIMHMPATGIITLVNVGRQGVDYYA